MSASKPNRVTIVLMAGSLLFSSTAASAASTPQPVSQISPWAALSVFGTQSSKAAVCGASAASAAAAQGAQPGCVLPAVDAPIVPAEASVVPVAPIPVAGSTGVPPLLLALAAIATGAFILAMNDDDDDIPMSPN